MWLNVAVHCICCSNADHAVRTLIMLLVLLHRSSRVRLPEWMLAQMLQLHFSSRVASSISVCRPGCFFTLFRKGVDSVCCEPSCCASACSLDSTGKVVGSKAIIVTKRNGKTVVSKHERHVLQYGDPQSLTAEIVSNIGRRWQPNTLSFVLERESTHYAWYGDGSVLLCRNS